MKRFWFAIAAVLVLPVAVFSLVQHTLIISSGTLPGTCTVGGLFLKTGTSSGLYLCLSTNTWTGPLGSGGGGGDGVGRFGVFFDGGGSPITTGTSKPFRLPDVAGTITRVTLYADVACDAEIDLWLAAYSASAYPTNSDSVTGGNEPALTTDLSMEDDTLTSWTTSFSGGETGVVNIDSTSGCGYLVVAFEYAYSV